MSKLKPLSILVWILAVTFLIRVAASLWVNIWEGPDWSGYVNTARDILAGQGIKTSYHPPLYSVFLSGVFGVFGESLGVLQILQSLLSVFVGGTIYILGRTICSQRAGLIGAAIYAVYVPSIAFRLFAGPVYLSSENIFIPLFLAVVTVLICGTPGHLRWAAAGVLFGLACLARPVALPFLGLLALWTIGIVTSKPAQFSIGRIVGAFLVFLFAAVAVMTPWTVYNARRYQAFVPVTTSGGHVLLGGNNPHAIGMWHEPHLYPEYDYIERIQNYSENQAAYRNEVLSFLKKTPLSRLLPYYAWKFWLFWDNFDDRFNWMYGALLPLAGIGLWLTRKQQKAWLIHLGIANFLLISLIFYANSRMRFPAEPFLVVLAGVTIERLFAAPRERGNSLFFSASIFAAHVIVYLVLYFSWPWIATRNKVVVSAWILSTLWLLLPIHKRFKRSYSEG